MSTLTDNSRTQVGGKAAVLFELQNHGFPVPDFVVVSNGAGLASQSGVISRDELIERCGDFEFPVAVRSSASAEDGPTASFAGQFRTELHVSTPAALCAAVDRCFESVAEEAVADYCRQHGVSRRDLRMSVIVQRMLRPELAGVAFTVNPLTGEERVAIEATRGVADRLLAGQDSALPDTDPLLESHRDRITDLALDIQRHFGSPQDIEFAVEDDRLFVLQSRPITRIRFPPSVGEWTNADFRDGGVSSTVCSPLMWSLYELIWKRTLIDCLRDVRLLNREFPTARLFFGRPYWNLGAVKQCVARIPGFVEREFDSDLNVQIGYEGNGICTPFTLGGVLRILPAALAVRRFVRRQSDAARQLLATPFDVLEKRYELPVGDVTESLRSLITVDYLDVESVYFRTIFALSLAKMEFKMSYPDADYAALTAALPEIRHTAPLRRARALRASGETDLSPLVQEFRHHYRSGLDIIQRRWDEDADFVLSLLQSLPDSPPADPRPAYEKALDSATSGMGRGRRRVFCRRLNRLRELVWLREELRDLSGRLYYLIRRHALAIANERDIGDDAFFMTWRALLEDDRTEIAECRRVYESYRNFAAPNEIGGRFQPQSPPSGDELSGIAASPGIVTGPARVAITVDDASEITEGEILVCPFTDPGWTPVLTRAGGVVTENGGMLSHAAVICRELSVPAVLGVPNACKHIATGTHVLLDGSAGLVSRSPQ